MLHDLRPQSRWRELGQSVDQVGDLYDGFRSFSDEPDPPPDACIAGAHLPGLFARDDQADPGLGYDQTLQNPGSIHRVIRRHIAEPSGAQG